MKGLNFFNKKILVVGLGKTGRSVITYLYGKALEITAYDLNLDDKKFNFFKNKYLKVKFSSQELLDLIETGNFDFIVLSPGISRYDLAILKAQDIGIKIISDIEIFLYELDRKITKIIAITGSNGKSTVTKLCGFLCQTAGLKVIQAGNIGIPVLDVLDDIKNNLTDVIILELSSFQLEIINNLSADVATCLNISQDHLDRYQDLLEYAYIKDKVFNGVKVQVLNYNDVLCKAMARKGVKKVWIAINNNCEYYVKSYKNKIDLMHLNKKLLSMDKMLIYGIHNAFNILTALALCKNIGINVNQLINKLPSFKGLSHRLERVASINNIVFIDDSKGTNVGSTCAAICAINGVIVLIAGGDGKGQDFSELAQIINQKVKKVFLIGKDANNIAKELTILNFNNFKICSSLEKATLLAFDYAQGGDIILLSPACASYDMFKGYEHRAQVFLNTINKIKSLNV